MFHATLGNNNIITYYKTSVGRCTFSNKDLLVRPNSLFYYRNLIFCIRKCTGILNLDFFLVCVRGMISARGSGRTSTPTSLLSPFTFQTQKPSSFRSRGRPSCRASSKPFRLTRKCRCRWRLHFKSSSTFLSLIPSYEWIQDVWSAPTSWIKIPWVGLWI